MIERILGDVLCWMLGAIMRWAGAVGLLDDCDERRSDERDT